jgi:glutaredoxin
MSGPERAPIELRLLSRPDCHLCEVMKETVRQASLGLDVRFTEVDISNDEELLARFGNDIPVLFVNGSRAFKHRATAAVLRRRLLLEGS